MDREGVCVSVCVDLGHGLCLHLCETSSSPPVRRAAALRPTFTLKGCQLPAAALPSTQTSSCHRAVAFSLEIATLGGSRLLWQCWRKLLGRANVDRGVGGERDESMREKKSRSRNLTC